MELGELVRLANERVSITQAFSLAGYDVGYMASSGKVYCPFGNLYHVDHGATRAMKVYPNTNSAWCFAGCGYFDPVKLMAEARDISVEQAAEAILTETGWVAPTAEALWDSLMNEPEKIDTADLAEALKVACSRMSPYWEDIQFEGGVAKMLTRCLSLLSKVRTAEDAQRWMTVAKEAMREALRSEPWNET